MDIFVVGFRTVFFYFLILIVYRIMGKREVGQLGIIDLIVSILIAEFVAISIDNHEESLLMAVIPILILLFFQIGFAYMSLKSYPFRNIMDGKPVVIINEGKIMLKEMLKQRYNLDDLLTQLREKNIKSVNEVEYAVLENSGKLSVFTYQNSAGNFPMPIILDGKIEKDSLKILDKNDNWVYYLLEKEALDIKNVFYAFYTHGKLFVIKQEDLIKKSV